MLDDDQYQGPLAIRSSAQSSRSRDKNAQLPMQVSQAAPAVQPHAPRNADHTQHEHFKLTLTGFLHRHGRANDFYKGAQLREILENLEVNMEAPPPFETVSASTGFSRHGVVKVSNIPYTVTVQEIKHFITRFTVLPMLKKNEEGWPIHIIMEKPTGKTMESFIEFPSHEAAKECVKRFEHTTEGRLSKIGNRNVIVDLSDQAELMGAVFPRARFAKFDPLTGRPHILSHDEDPSWTEGFRGYFTREEIFGLTRFAETPARSPFVLKCNQRVYESLISTLYKFPWAATQTYSVAARNILFDAAYRQLQILSWKVRVTLPSESNSVMTHRGNQGHHRGYVEKYYQANAYDGKVSARGTSNSDFALSQILFFDLLFAAINVPSFSPLQKFGLCKVAGDIGRGVPLNDFSEFWPFQTMRPDEHTPKHVTKFWLELFESGVDVCKAENAKSTYEHYINVARNKFGRLVCEWTVEGVRLPFEDAIQMEMNMTMIYITRGRNHWAQERGLTIEKWQPGELVDLMQSIEVERARLRKFGPGAQRFHSYDSSISPTATEFVPHMGLLEDVPAAASRFPYATEAISSRSKDATNSKLNPATAKDFVPITGRGPSVLEPTTNNIYSLFKSIWSDPPLGAALPSRTRLSNFVLDTGRISTTTANPGRFDHIDQPGTIAAQWFRDPFDKTNNLRMDPSFQVPPSTLNADEMPQRAKESGSTAVPHDGRSLTMSLMESLPRLSLANPISKPHSLDLSSRNQGSTLTRPSTSTTLLSACTPSTTATGTTSGSPTHRPSLIVTIPRYGSPTPATMPDYVQKYPNLTYSTVRYGQGNGGQFDARESPMGSISGGGGGEVATQILHHGQIESEGQGQGQGPNQSTTTRPPQNPNPTLFSPASFTFGFGSGHAPGRAQGYNPDHSNETRHYPNDPYDRKINTNAIVDPAPARNDPHPHSHQRPSLPTHSLASTLFNLQRGITVGSSGSRNGSLGARTDVGVSGSGRASVRPGSASGSGRLSAGELWRDVSGYRAGS